MLDNESGNGKYYGKYYRKYTRKYKIGVRGEGEARSPNGRFSSCAHVGAGRGPDGGRRRARGLLPSVPPPGRIGKCAARAFRPPPAHSLRETQRLGTLERP